jgi:hypothetical protein
MPHSESVLSSQSGPVSVSCVRLDFDQLRIPDKPTQYVPGEEVPKMSELAVVRVLNIDNTPAVFASANGLAVNDNIGLRANDGEWDHVLVT